MASREARAPGRRFLHLDCFAGASGNMLLGSLLSLGVPAKIVREGLASLEIEGLRMRVSRVRRGALAAHYVAFSGPKRQPRERRFTQIRALLRRAPLSSPVRENALRVFTALARAESRVHGVDPEQVHFHEVGAVDALGDIVGVCLALEHLQVEVITASALALGSGTVETEHGRLPLPAPATLELLRGVPTYPAEGEGESVTPTGAALLVTLVQSFGPMPAGVPSAQGFGAGEDRRGPLPNVLRSILGVSGPAPMGGDRVTVLETNLDDMSPEHLAYLVEELMSDGALDVSLSPLSMKKGRPGQLLRVIVRPIDRDRLARRVLLESSAIGLRYQDMSRLVLERTTRRVSTPFGPITVKVIRTPDGRNVTTPEYEACARAARKHGVSLQIVYRAVTLAAENEVR